MINVSEVILFQTFPKVLFVNMFLEKMFHLTSGVNSSVQESINNGGKDLVYSTLLILIVPVMGHNQFFRLKSYTDLFPNTFH